MKPDIQELIWSLANEFHLKRHAVLPEEAEEVCLLKPVVIRRSRKNTLAVFGQTEAGRYLMVVLAPRGKGRYYVVTARDMNKKEKREIKRFRKLGR